MIFTGANWYFGLIQALLLITEIVFGLTVAKSRPVLRKILLVAVAVWFLGRKIGEIMTNHEVPFDFSAVAYFADLFRRRVLQLYRRQFVYSFHDRSSRSAFFQSRRLYGAERHV